MPKQLYEDDGRTRTDLSNSLRYDLIYQSKEIVLAILREHDPKQAEFRYLFNEAMSYGAEKAFLEYYREQEQLKPGVQPNGFEHEDLEFYDLTNADIDKFFIVTKGYDRQDAESYEGKVIRLKRVNASPHQHIWAEFYLAGDENTRYAHKYTRVKRLEDDND